MALPTVISAGCPPSPTESDPQNNFTASPDGSWVATAGNLGLAVWNSSGTLLWSQSWPDAARRARAGAQHHGVLVSERADRNLL